jgi:hypothetical protein
MNRYGCEKETRVLEALGSWDAELRAHIKDCPHCSDVVTVATFLQQEAVVGPSLPKPEFIWWKAQLRARQVDARRIVRPIAWAGNFAGVISAVTIGWFFWASYPRELGAAHLWTGDLAIVGVGVGIVCALLGSAYMVWVEK